MTPTLSRRACWTAHMKVGHAILLALTALLASCGEDAPRVATTQTKIPTVPEDYLWRWLPEEDYYEEALKSSGSDPELPDSWRENNVSLIREALRTSPSSFANPYLLTLQLGCLPRDLHEKFTQDEVTEVRQMMIDYLLHLRSIDGKPDAPPQLAWHALAMAAMTSRLWPDDFQQQSFETGVSRLEATPVWKQKNGDPEEEWLGEYRVSATRLLIMDGLPWRMLDLKSMHWQDLVFPKSKDDEHPEPFRVGLSSTALATTEAVFDLATKTWQPLADPLGGELYLDDPVEAGDEWIVFYKNPPHYNLEKVDDFDRLPKAEQERWIESLRDRFHFISTTKRSRSVATDLDVNQWFLLPSNQLFVVGSEGRFPQQCQIKESIQLAADASNKSLETKLTGYFNGTWNCWNQGEASEKVVLEQLLDYEGRIPARAAVLDLQTGRWEILWNNPDPAIPAPPPGVLQEALRQTPRWELPAALARATIGTVQNMTPAISKDGKVFLLGLTRDVAASTFSLDLWVFLPGIRHPQRFHIVLAGYNPARSWNDAFPLPAIHPCKTGFLLADHVRGQIWHLEWNHDQTGSPPTKR